MTFTAHTLRQKRHEEVGENREILSQKRSEARPSAQPPFLGLCVLVAHASLHLHQETYSASFLKPMALLFVGVPLVPFQTWVFQGSGWEERTMVIAVRESDSSWEMLRAPAHLWLPSHAHPSALEGSDSAGGDHRGPCTEWLVQPPCTVLLDLPTQPSVPL